MLPTHLNVGVMLSGYLLVMGYLAIGLRIRRRHPTDSEHITATHGRRMRHGWPGLVRQVVYTAIGGYALLMAVVVGYYYGVVRLGGRFLASAFTGSATLVGIALPVYFIASWLVERRHSRRSADEARRRPP
ncbi:hypothetical protein K4749_27990 [Streptomyces sp. TRM72054]|uniref:DUF6256 family protein n=1 Tax=Streptomyces sp. TRM72054 TaxID=2870562 RepID=UPI001C8C0B7B|nr:DUF6256 family protein [Streptomyces sp. TRM72054]MBX9397323.1 hypothetical protein [Streptomyces sp. TRM72054]